MTHPPHLADHHIHRSPRHPMPCRQLQQQWLAQQGEIRQLKEQLAAAAAAAGTAAGAAGAASPSSRLRVLPPGPSTPRHLRRGMPPTPGRHLQQPSSRLQPLAQQQQQQQVVGLQVQPQLQSWAAPVSLSPSPHIRGGGSPDAGQPQVAHSAWRQAQQQPVPVLNLLTPRRALTGSSILSQVGSSNAGTAAAAAAAAAAAQPPAGAAPLETPRRRYAASPWPRLPDAKAVVQQAQSSGSQVLDPVMDD
jgi:hypothetical protein